MHKPESEKCVRTWNVHSRPDVDSLIGSIITCADADDILSSKVCHLECATQLT